MPISNTNPQPRDVVIIQRDDGNSYYGETHISGSSLIIYIDSQGHINADISESFYTSFPPPAAGLVVGGTYPITASWAIDTVNGGGGTTLFTGSLYFITASWAQTASFALNAGSGGTTLVTGSTYPVTSSWANNSKTASLALTASSAPIPSASQIPMLFLPNSQFTNVQNMQDIFHSAGWVSGGTVISESASGSYSVSAGQGLIRAVNGTTSSIYWFGWNSASFTASNLPNQEFFVYVNYNSGTPIIKTSSVDPALSDYQTNVSLAKIYYVSSSDHQELHINPTIRETVGDHAKLMIRFNQAVMPYARESGGIIGTSGGLTFNISAGSWWEGLNRFTTTAFDSSGSGRFSKYYLSGSTWVETENQQFIDNFYWNNTASLSGTSSLDPAYYTVRWSYLAVDGDVHNVWDRNEYNSLTSASAASPPTQIPPELSTDSFLIGRIIIQSGSSAPAEIDSAFFTPFTTAPASSGGDHNSLSGLQGGAPGQYYHLTAAEYTGTGTGVFVRQDGATLTNVQASGSLFGTASWAQSASWIDPALITIPQTILFASSSMEADISLLAFVAITSSYAQTSSWAINAINGGTQLVTGSPYPITSSWSNFSQTASVASTASYALSSSVLSVITSSNIDARYFLTFVTGSNTSSFQTFYIDSSSNLTYDPFIDTLVVPFITASVFGTSSWSTNATNARTASNANSASVIGITTGGLYYLVMVTGSSGYQVVYADTTDVVYNQGTSTLIATNLSASSITASQVFGTASWAVNAINGGTQLVTGSSYPITASWANNTFATTIVTGSVLQVTSSRSITASNALFSTTASHALNAETASISIVNFITQSVTSSSFADTASTASYAITASYSVNSTTASFALNAGGVGPALYTNLSTGSNFGITCSFSDSNESVTLITPSLYVFTSSNTPPSGYVVDVFLHISQSSTSTSSLSFPSSWINLGAGWPTSITASKSALVWLRSKDGNIIMGTYNVQL